MRRIFFFATPKDIVPVLRCFEADGPIKFAEDGAMSRDDRKIYMRASDIPNPGISTHEIGSISQSFAVLDANVPYKMYDFIDNLGRIKSAIHNNDNEDTVMLTIAGIWKGRILLPGNIATLHDTKSAQSLMRRFLRALRQENFVKIEQWWLGAEALQMLKNGERLTTTAEQSPPEFDLKLP